MESDIGTAKDKFKDNCTSHFLENKRIQKEEVDLIVAINEFKREFHDKKLAVNTLNVKSEKDKNGVDMSSATNRKKNKEIRLEV